MLTKEAILQADDLPVEVVEVPEWGGSVRVRGMNCADRDAYVSALSTAKKGDSWDLKGLKPKLVQLCTLNGGGELMFTPGDLEALGRKASSAIDRIWDVAMRLSGMLGEQQAFKSAEGNSGSAGSDGSGSS